MNEPTYVYRGVHGRHIMLAAALNGTVVPGDSGGDMTPEEHNLLQLSEASPYTSWTFSLAIARRFAASRGKGGVVLRLPFDKLAHGDDWRWVSSPDRFGEQEVLLFGARIGAEVLHD